MSGLAGFTFAPLGDRGRQIRDLERMRDRLVPSGLPPCDPWSDEDVAATLVPTRLTPEGAPFAKDDVHVWLDGEILSASTLCPSARHGAEAIASGYLAAGNFDFLARSDGMFAATVYDRVRRKVFLVTDRFGMQFVFFRQSRGQLAWCSELKGFLGLAEFRPRLDRAAIAHFLELGFYFEDETAFEDVKLLPGGTVLEWDLVERRATLWPYWSPDRIAPMQGRIDERELLEEAGRRFSAAVARTCEGSRRIGVLLSGGLDSRAILAALPARYARCPVLTLGNPRCTDHRLARQVAAIRSNPHHFYEITADSWLGGRIEAVWRTDGLVPLLHLHSSGGLSRILEAFDVNLSGLFLDSTLGGAYLDRLHDRSEEWLLMNRGRRFCRAGMRGNEPGLLHRAPGLDAQLLELALAIPARLRSRAGFYRRMLMASHPRYFRGIAWQRTGLPAWAPLALVDARHVADKAYDRLRRIVGLAPFDWRQYVDYPRWLGLEPARSLVRHWLAAPDALYPEFVNRQDVLANLDLHLSRKAVRSEEIGRVWTLEIWLRQLAAGGSLTSTDQASSVAR